MTDKLKLCPFCGRRPELRYDDDGFAYIICANDGCYVKTDGHLNADAAIKAWNTRKPIEQIIEQLEEDSQMALYEMGESGIYAGLQSAIEIVKKGGVE